ALARIGAEYDVEVGPDSTMFTLTTLTRFAARGTALLSLMLTRPSLRESDVERVRQLRLDRVRQLKDLPPAVAERTFSRRLYPAHPYGHLAIGTETSLRGIDVNDVVSFHASTFTPPRAAIVAAGAMPHQELLAIVEEAFSDWSDTAAPSEPIVAAA